MSKKKKLTPWFPFSVMPVRKGVYERSGYGVKAYQYWDGRHWIFGGRTPILALEWGIRCPDQVCISPDRWRGLASDPKGK